MMVISSTATVHSYKPSAAMAAEALPNIGFADADDLLVYHISADGTEAVEPLERDTDYSIVIPTSGVDGTITALAEWPADDVFFIERNTARTQARRFPTDQALQSEQIEAGLDALTHQNQEQDREIDRAVKVPRGEVPPAIGAYESGQVAVFLGGQLVGADSDVGSSAEILAAADAAANDTIAAAASAAAAEVTASEVEDALSDLAATSVTQFDEPADASAEATGTPFACGQEYGLAHDVFAKTSSGHTYTKTIAIDAAAVSLAAIERDWLRDYPLPVGVYHYNGANLALNDRRGIPSSTVGAMALDRILIADTLAPRNETGSEANPDTVGRDENVLGPDNATFATTANYDSTGDQLYIANGNSISDTFELTDTIRMGGWIKRVSGDASGAITYRFGSSSNVNGTDGNPAYADTVVTDAWQAATVAQYVGRASTVTSGFSVRPATGTPIVAQNIAVFGLWAKDDWGGTDDPSFTQIKDWHGFFPAKAPAATRGSAEVDGPYFQTTSECMNLVVSLNKAVDFSAGYTLYSTLKTVSDAGAAGSAAAVAVGFARQRGITNADKNQDVFGQIGCYKIDGTIYMKPILSSVVSGVIAKIGDRGDIFLGLTATPLSTDPGKAYYTVYINGVLMGIFKDDWDVPDAEILTLGANDLGKNRALGSASSTIDYGAQFGWASRPLIDDEMVGLAKGADAYLKAHGNAGGLNISNCWCKGADSTRAFDEAPDFWMQDLRPIGEIDVMEARGGSSFEVNNVSTDVTDYTADQFNDAWREDYRNRCAASVIKMGCHWFYIGVGSVNDLVVSRSLSDSGHFIAWEEGRAAIFAYAAADRLRIIALAQTGDFAVTEAEALERMHYLAQTISARADYFGGPQEVIRQAFNDDLLNNGFAEANGVDGYFNREGFVPSGFASKDDAVEDAHLNGDNTYFLQGNGGVHWADQAAVADSQQYEYDEERRVMERAGIV